MLTTNISETMYWWLDNTTVFVHSYPHVMAALWFFLASAVAILLFGVKAKDRLAQAGRFDQELWERVLTLILQHRTKDAVALAQVSEGIFPRLYLAGLEAAASRRNAADMITTIKEDSQEELSRPLGFLTVVGFLAPFVGLLATAASVWSVYEDTSLTAAIGLARLLPPLVPAVIGLLTGLLAGAVYGYFTLRVRRIMGQMHLCGLKLLHTLFEQTVTRYEAQLKRKDPAPEPELVGAVGASRGPGLSDGAGTASRGPRPAAATHKTPATATRPVVKPSIPKAPSWPPTTMQPEAATPVTPRPEKPAVDQPVSDSVWDRLGHHRL